MTRADDAQSDALPEDTHYRDSGCDLHDRCLTCPLKVCRYDMPPNRARQYIAAIKLDKLLRDGLSLDTAGREMGLNPRTTFRLYTLARKGRPTREVA